MTAAGYRFHPFRVPPIPPDREFANHMGLVMMDAILGRFDENLWGLAIACDLGAHSVGASLWFESRPSLLDRDAMGEVASAFDVATDGAVALDLRWRVGPRAGHGALDRSLEWIHLGRSPLDTLPDGFDADDLKY